MNRCVEYALNQASEVQIVEHLLQCSDNFVPPLGDRVHLDEYGRKIFERAMRFEGWSDGRLIGLVAAYWNRALGSAFVTSVSLLRPWVGQGCASILLSDCIEHARRDGFQSVKLEVDSRNIRAIKLYRKLGFIAREATGALVLMELEMNTEKTR